MVLKAVYQVMSLRLQATQILTVEGFKAATAHIEDNRVGAAVGE